MGISLLAATSVNIDQGIVTPYGLTLPPGSQVAAYVRSTGQQAQDTAYITTNLVATLAQGLARVRSGLGDFVVVLPGHVESVADATTFSGALLAGTNIVGVGTGTATPTFTWTVAAANWAVNKANVQISGLRLLMDGFAGAVTSGITVTAADFGFRGNEVETSTGATLVTTAITLGAGSDRADVSGNIFRSGVTGQASTCVLTSAASSDQRVCDNEMVGSWLAATGAINVTGAVVNLKILRNIIRNTIATSVGAINFANVASGGFCVGNRLNCNNGGAMVSGTNVIVIGAATTFAFADNLCSNDPKTSGIILPTADT